jgi:membrane protease YdiL (CAAX protease family)
MEQVPDSSDSGIRNPHSDVVPWTLRDLGYSVLLGLGGMFGFALLLMATLTWIIRLTGHAEWRYLTSGVILVGELGLLLPVWLLGIRKYHLPWRSIGLRGFHRWRATQWGCSFVLLSFAFNAAWGLLLGLVNLRTQPDVLPAFGGGSLGLLLALLAGGVMAPVAEEGFFRGYLFAGPRCS